MTENAKKPPAKPSRSPVERAIVWGAILIGLVVITIEGQAWFAHNKAFGALQARLKAYEDGASNSGLTKDEVEKLVNKKPSQSNELKAGDTDLNAAWLDIYDYPGLVRKRQLFVYYGIPGKKDQLAEVVQIGTSATDTMEQAMAKAPTPPPSGPPTSPMGGGMGAGTEKSAGGGGASGEGPAAPGRRGRGGASRRGENKSEGAASRPPVEGDETKAGETKKADEPKKEAEPAKEEAGKTDEAKPATESGAEKP